MEMSDDFFELANKGSDWFMGKETRCLDAYALLCFEKLTVFEAKYGPINFEIYCQTCKAWTLLRDSKGDPTVNACNRSLQNQERFQQEVLSWGSLAPVFNDFYQAHVEYEKLYGEQKIELRNKRQALLLTNGDVLEKEAAGGLCKKGTAMTAAAAETQKLVAFAKKGEEMGAPERKHCGLTHVGRCTKQANVQTKYDQASPFVQEVVNSKTEKEKKTAVHGMIEMLAQNVRPGAGRGQGFQGASRGGPPKSGGSHVAGMPVKGKQISPDMIQAVRDEGGCIGHANGNCNFRPRCKFPHLSDSVLQCIAKDVAARKKSAVALVADGKKDSLHSARRPPCRMEQLQSQSGACADLGLGFM